jgi:hypothetical protein
MRLFDDMEAQGLRKDSVAFKNGIRAAGFCRSWERTLEILQDAHTQLLENVQSVAHTAVTNLKYYERSSASSVSAVNRSWEIMRWLTEKGILPSEKTMVSKWTATFSNLFSLLNIFLYG